MADGFLLDGQALIWRSHGETLRVEPWGANALRVRATMNAEFASAYSALLDPAQSQAEVAIRADGATIRNGRIQAAVSLEGQIQWTNTRTGQMVLAEAPVKPMHARPRQFKAVGGDLFRGEARFVAHDDERMYGLGQHRHGRLNQKGCVIDLEQRNCEVTIPLLISSRGYALLWNLPGVGRVELGATQTRWVAQACRQMDYWVTVGDSYAELLSAYADATGHAPPLPEFAAGFWQCKLRYQTQEELLGVAREYKRRGLPLDVIVIDYFHWPVMGDWCFDERDFPDPAAMVRELKEMGVELMVSVWPSVNPQSKNYWRLERRGLLLRTERGARALFRTGDAPDLNQAVYVEYYDPTNPEARQFIWEKMRENYGRYGIRVYWLDACEPEIAPADHENLRYHAGNGLEVGCLYPLAHQQAFYEGLKADGENQIITLCRSAWAGSQRYGAAVWSGDIDSTFESLANQVRAGLNIGLSGIPWWTTDIGGFLNGDPRTEYFRELIVRWFQFGVFCPLFRLHGYRQPATFETGAPNEIWSFGDKAYEIIKEILFLRERLKPYVMAQMRVAHETGRPVMRPLFFDFPKDAGTAAVEDQFMFGPDILVAPVLAQGQTQRAVYLPAGAKWTDPYSGQVYDGGQTITADAPLERVPVYLRDGAKWPIVKFD
ncbi:MAG: hypothetical protein IT443_04855 [Phycisphaeraceae bacterium]|nr:hypothetical protein [Phycisphaeraceae bacterium]